MPAASPRTATNAPSGTQDADSTLPIPNIADQRLLPETLAEAANIGHCAGICHSTRETHMAFVQIIEFKSNKIDEMRKLEEEWSERAGPSSTATRVVLCEDRDQPGRYFQMVFFDSYESAM